MDDCGYLWRSKGMILDCPQTWNWNRTLLNINRPVHRNQTHSLKILSVSFTTLTTKSIFLAKPEHWRIKIFREILRSLPSKSLQLLSSHRLQWPVISKAQTILVSTTRFPFCSWTPSFTDNNNNHNMSNCSGNLNSLCLFSKYSFLEAAMSRSPSSRALHWYQMNENTNSFEAPPDIGSVPTVCRSKFAPLPCLIQFHCEAAEIVVDFRICRSRGSLG